VEEERCEHEHSKINTEDPSPVAPGNVEIETAYSFMTANKALDEKGETISRGYRAENAFDVGIGVGILEDFDAGVGMGYVTMRDNDTDQETGRGFGDIGVGARWRFWRDDKYHIEFAYLQGLTVPVGNSENERELAPGQKFWSADQRFAFCKDWPKWTLGTDFGFEIPFGEKREDCRGVASANVAAGYKVFDWLQPEIELNGSREIVNHDSASETLAVTVGVILLFGENWKFMAGAQQVLLARNADKETSLIASLTLCW